MLQNGRTSTEKRFGGDPIAWIIPSILRMNLNLPPNSTMNSDTIAYCWICDIIDFVEYKYITLISHKTRILVRGQRY